MLLKVLKYKCFPFLGYLGLPWCFIYCLMLYSLGHGNTCGTKTLHFLTCFCANPTSCWVFLPASRLRSPAGGREVKPGISLSHGELQSPRAFANACQDALGTWVRNGRETYPLSHLLNVAYSAVSPRQGQPLLCPILRGHQATLSLPTPAPLSLLVRQELGGES